MPTFQHAALPNGLTVIAEVDPAAHSAAAGFFVKTGARDEDSAVMGVSHFLEHMMFKGTDRRSAAEVDRDFDDIGADHNAFTTSEMTAFHVHTLPEHFPRALEVLADIMRPAIRPEDFNSEKGVILEEIAMYNDYPFWLLYERAMEEFYGSHPLSHRVLGTTRSITELTQPQMVEYFTQRYSADNTVLAAAGRLDFERLVREADTWCGAWNTTRAGRALIGPQLRPAEFAMTSPSVHRHYLLMLCPAPGSTDERRYASAMLAQILGDADGSRLYWALIETGFAEEAQAQYEGRDGVGELLVYASCSTDHAQEVEAVVRRELDNLVNSLTPDDLERTRSKVATAATLHGELPAGRMKRLGRLWTYAGAYRSLDDELARINAVTLDDLVAVHKAFPMQPIVTGRLGPEH